MRIVNNPELFGKGVLTMGPVAIIGLGLLTWIVVVAAAFAWGFWTGVGVFIVLVFAWAALIGPGGDEE